MNTKLRRITLISLAAIIYLISIKMLQKSNLTYEHLKIMLILERAKGPLKPYDPNLINIIRSNYLIPPSTSNYNLSNEKHYKDLIQSSSWKFIDSKLQAIFKDQPPGFFVEAGALDGEMLSNTLRLEKKKGWTGILIEPDGANFAALLKKNRKSWLSRSCLATTPYPKLSTFISYSPSKEISEKSSALDWYLRSLASELESGLKMPPFIYKDQEMYEIYGTIQCFPLESFLYALNVTVVDFLSLDIQGGEVEVLKLFPWDKFTIRTLAIEYLVNGNHKVLNEDLMMFMKERNYTLIGVSEEPDYFYIKNNDILLKNIT